MILFRAQDRQEKPAANRSPAPVIIHHLRDSCGWHRLDDLAPTTQPFAARHHRELGLTAQRLDGGIEVGGLIEAVQLALVGEHDVDDTFEIVEKFRTMTVEKASDNVSATRRPALCAMPALDEGLLTADPIDSLRDMTAALARSLRRYGEQVLGGAEKRVHRSLLTCSITRVILTPWKDQLLRAWC